MEPTFELEIITPEKTFYRGVISSLIAPQMNGYFGILAHHAPLIARSAGGRLKIRKSNTERYFEIGPGLIEVFKNRVTVLTKSAAPLTAV